MWVSQCTVSHPPMFIDTPHSASGFTTHELLEIHIYKMCIVGMLRQDGNSSANRPINISTVIFPWRHLSGWNGVLNKVAVMTSPLLASVCIYLHVWQQHFHNCCVNSVKVLFWANDKFFIFQKHIAGYWSSNVAELSLSHLQSNAIKYLSPFSACWHNGIISSSLVTSHYSHTHI